jgi:predicted 2-oxoglutarate/Fe(II)-dependent dioxygenase YbiX
VRDAGLLRELSSVVGRRVMPEVRKAFAFRATRFEGFKIGCYDASTGGFFRPHRDNLTSSTAHRVFALTLNLNDGYEGGQLRFPEYGNQLYRPDAGAALIFSCAHLHEVLDVTAGRRFVLLSFLYGEAAAGRTTLVPTARSSGVVRLMLLGGAGPVGMERAGPVDAGIGVSSRSSRAAPG